MIFPDHVLVEIQHVPSRGNLPAKSTVDHGFRAWKRVGGVPHFSDRLNLPSEQGRVFRRRILRVGVLE